MKSTCFTFIFLLFFNFCNNKKFQANSSDYTADYYYNQGLTDYYNGKYKESLKNYEKAISIDSTISDYFLGRGVIKSILNDTVSALKDYRKAIQLNKQNDIAYFNVGCLLSDQGQDKEAIKFYTTCIEINPDYYPVYYNCAYSQYKIKDYTEALKNFDKAITYEDDQKFFVYYYMGLIYKSTGELGKAKEYLEKAKALGNNDAEEELKTF